MKTVDKHCRDCGPACNVKTHGMQFVDGGTEEQRNAAWEITQAEFWSQAEYIAQQCGFDALLACGRSGGWAAPYYFSHTTRTFPSMDDPTDARRFSEFADRMVGLMQRVPDAFAAALKEQMDE